MAIVFQRIIVVGVGALPSQLHLVGVAVIPVDHIGGRMDGAGIGDADGALRIAPVQAGGVINCGGVIDLVQAGSGHGDGHSAGVLVRRAIRYGELPGRLIPLSDLLGAGSILEPLQFDVLFVVHKAFAECIDKGVCSEGRGIGGDGGQGGDDLIVHHIPVRAGAGVGVAICDIVCSAVMLASVRFGFPQGLLQGGHIRLILGVDCDVVVPILAVDGRHRQGYEEGGCGLKHILGNVSFHHQIQAQIQAGSAGMTGFIGLR